MLTVRAATQRRPLCRRLCHRVAVFVRTCVRGRADERAALGAGPGATASLYYTDPEYDALSELVGVTRDEGTVDRSGLGHENGPGVTVTWLIHDVTPWRVDHIYLEGKGAPWIATQVWRSSPGRSGTARSSGTSRRNGTGADPTLLEQPRRRSDRQGGRAGVSDRARRHRAGPGRARASAAPTPTDDTSDASARDRVWWGLGGLAGGVLLAAGWMRVRSTRLRARADDTVAPRADVDPTTEWISVGP